MDLDWQHFSLKQHRTDSFESAGSFDVVTLDDVHDVATENTVEWEDLGARNNPFCKEPTMRKLSVKSEDVGRNNVDEDEIPEEIEIEIESDDNQEPLSIPVQSVSIEFAQDNVNEDEIDEIPEEIEVEIENDDNQEPLTIPVSIEFAPAKSSRESLRNFYLTRAKWSEASSKHFNCAPVVSHPKVEVIAPLRAPERYNVEVIEQAIRQENTTKAQQALQAFYAERDAKRERRRAENRLNENGVEASQVGLRALAACRG